MRVERTSESSEEMEEVEEPASNRLPDSLNEISSVGEILTREENVSIGRIGRHNQVQQDSRKVPSSSCILVLAQPAALRAFTGPCCIDEYGCHCV